MPEFGLAVENFTPASKPPSIDAVLRYGELAEALGFRSLWAWDHILLGSKRPFPFLESLTTLTALAVRTRTVRLGTGVLVLPLRNPVVLAKAAATIDHVSGGRLTLGLAAGWYQKEFDACGVSFTGRGAVFERHLEVVQRLWLEDDVSGRTGDFVFDRAVMLPKPVQRPRPTLLIGGYVDRVLRRVAERSDGWLTYFYTAESFGRNWAKVRRYAEAAGRDPAELRNVAQLPICVAGSYEEADRRVREFVGAYFDVAEWSESTPESAVRGTPEQCAEQLRAHLDAGAEHVVLVPWNYEPDQVDTIATEVLPLLGGMG